MGAEPRPVDDRWLALLVEASADVVAVLDDSAVLLYANPAAETLFGYDLDARRGQSVVDLLHPDDLGLALGSLDSMLTRTDRPGEPIEVRVRTSAGSWAHVELVATNRLQDERFGGLILAIRDITDRRAAERGRASAERVLDHTFAHNPIGMTLCTLDGRFVKVNPAFCALVGRTEAEVLADTYQGLTDPDELAAEQEALVAVIRGDEPSFTTDKRISRPDGTMKMGELTVSMVEDPDGVRLIFGQLRDVTDQRELQRELEHRSLHDPLTGLANRALFKDRVTVAHRRHRRYGAGIAIAFVDLDDFKTVNDALGHAAGDELLRGVAERLTNRFRASDTVARVGGDEFAVLLDESGESADAERQVESERARRDDGDVADERVLAELHDGALAELLFDLADREIDGAIAIHLCCHGCHTPSLSPRVAVERGCRPPDVCVVLVPGECVVHREARLRISVRQPLSAARAAPRARPVRTGRRLGEWAAGVKEIRPIVAVYSVIVKVESGEWRAPPAPSWLR